MRATFRCARILPGLATILIIGLMSAPPAAAATPDPGTSPVSTQPKDDGSTAKTTTATVAISSDQCQALARIAPQEAATILSHCYATVTMTRSALVTPSRNSAKSNQVVAAGLPAGWNGSPCGYRGYQTYSYKWNQFPAYWVMLTAKVEVDVCNNLQWDWTRTDWGTIWPFSFTWRWDGARPGGWNYYTNTYVETDYSIGSTFSSGSGGASWSIDPINMQYYNVQKWGL